MCLDLVERFYTSGAIRAAYFVSNGWNRHGTGVQYYEDGSVKFICNFVDDELHGPCRVYREGNGYMNQPCVSPFHAPFNFMDFHSNFIDFRDEDIMYDILFFHNKVLRNSGAPVEYINKEILEII